MSIEENESSKEAVERDDLKNLDTGDPVGIEDPDVLVPPVTEASGVVVSAKKSRQRKRKRGRRADDTPSQPLSAYNLFFREERLNWLSEREGKEEDEPKEEGEEKKQGSSVFRQMGKAIGARWKSLAPEKRARFDDLAKREQERYRREVEEYKQRLREENESKKKAAAAAPPLQDPKSSSNNAALSSHQTQGLPLPQQGTAFNGVGQWTSDNDMNQLYAQVLGGAQGLLSPPQGQLPSQLQMNLQEPMLNQQNQTALQQLVGGGISQLAPQQFHDARLLSAVQGPTGLPFGATQGLMSNAPSPFPGVSQLDTLNPNMMLGMSSGAGNMGQFTPGLGGLLLDQNQAPLDSGGVGMGVSQDNTASLISSLLANQAPMGMNRALQSMMSNTNTNTNANNPMSMNSGLQGLPGANTLAGGVGGNQAGVAAMNTQQAPVMAFGSQQPPPMLGWGTQLGVDVPGMQNMPSAPAGQQNGVNNK